jgi:16S rRNA (guanine966-N2)-methyltransferase
VSGWIGHEPVMSRIIAGSARGRRIAMPPGARTRPTTDRVREALFAALTSWAGTADQPAEQALANLVFCDLYAGSGAVALEAASRGAHPVLLVESDRRTAQLATKNATDLGLEVEVQIAGVKELTDRPATRAYDVVFADPPYELPSDAMGTVLAGLVEHHWLAPTGLVVVERSRRSPALHWPDALDQVWSRRYGETVLCFAMITGSVSQAPVEGER